MSSKDSTKFPKLSLNGLISIIKIGPEYLKSDLGIYAIGMHLGCIICVIGTMACLFAGVPHGCYFFLGSGFVIILTALVMAHNWNMNRPDPDDPSSGGRRSHRTGVPTTRVTVKRKHVSKATNSDVHQRPSDLLEIKVQPPYNRNRYVEQLLTGTERRTPWRLQSRLLRNCSFCIGAVIYMLKLAFLLYIRRSKLHYARALDRGFRAAVAAFLANVKSLYIVHRQINRKDESVRPNYHPPKAALTASSTIGQAAGAASLEPSGTSTSNCTEELNTKMDKFDSNIGNEIWSLNAMFGCQFYLN